MIGAGKCVKWAMKRGLSIRFGEFGRMPDGSWWHLRGDSWECVMLPDSDKRY